MSTPITIDEMATFCKREGFVYPNSEIYGGLSGFWDFGPLGAELKNNLKQEWWKFHVKQRNDIVGIDGSIIANPKVWEASGHVANFTDILVDCKHCGERYRADVLIEDALKIQTAGMKIADIEKTIAENNIKCPKCKSILSKPKEFNLMFKTNVGPMEGSTAYLRAETAQLIFADFRLVIDNARLKLPFGIAQMGRAFRNEISPRDFLFRCREFEQMEIEYFIHPEKSNECPYIKEIEDYELNVYSAEMQKNNEKEKLMKISAALNNKVIKSPWHGYWLATEHKWFMSLGANPENFRIRQHLPDEKAHYSTDCWDLEYKFPFGFKELEGIADRSDFDLQQHMKHSKKDMSIFDEETKQKVVPHVIAEPSQGVERAFLVFMFDAYNFDKERNNIVLKLHPKLAPYKAAICPLVSNKEEIIKKAKEVYDLLKKEFYVNYDKSGSIGRRYARNDEIGTPYCVTIDFDSINNDDVTIRDRDSTVQIRVRISDLKNAISRLINQEIKFEEAGKLISK